LEASVDFSVFKKSAFVTTKNHTKNNREATGLSFLINKTSNKTIGEIV